KANAKIGIVQSLQQLLQPFRGREIVGNVFHQQTDTQLPGESTQVFNGAERILEFAGIVGFIGAADVLHQETKRRVFRDLDRALDLVHGIDAVALVNIDNVQRLAAGTEIVAHVDGRMHGVELHALALEPAPNLFYMLFVVIVEVPARGKDLDCLRSATGESIQQPGVQAFLNVNVAGDSAQHQYPTALPPLRPSGAPSRSPVLGSTAMHSPSLQ